MSLKHCMDVTFMLGNKLSMALLYVWALGWVNLYPVSRIP